MIAIWLPATPQIVPPPHQCAKESGHIFYNFASILVGQLRFVMGLPDFYRFIDELVMNIERFLAGVEEQTNRLPESDRRQMLERLALARAFLGSHDPLDFFRGWKTPDERYTPRYISEEKTD